MEALSATSSILSLIDITIKVAVLSYEYIDKVKNAQSVVQKLFEELQMLAKTLGDLEKDARDPESTVLQRLESPIRSYRQEITRRHRKLESNKPLNRMQYWWKKLKWPLEEAETFQFLLEIERFKTNLLLAMSSDQSRGMKEIREHRRKEDIRRDDDKRVAVLNWLFPGSFNERHNEISGRRKKNTGQWILNAPEVQYWKKPGNHDLLWGYGIPGAGKTFLSSLMIDNLQGQVGYGVAYIYFNYKEQDKQKPTHVLSSLTKQLISQASTQPLPKKLENFHKDQKTPNSGELYDILLDVTKFFTRTFFIFDALDECDQSSQRKELLPLFHRMGGNGMKLFLTSREHPEDVQISFEKISKMKLWAKDEDVATYIEQKISEYPQAESLVSQGNYRKKIISELTDCAKGMFLLVHFHIECLCQQTTTKQILMELERIKRDSESSINKSLSPTYDRAMDILYAQHPPSRVELATRVLSWLVKARKVLTIHQLQEAVTADEDCTTFEESDLPHLQTMIDVCAGLVNFDKDSNAVRLVHYTAQEYLLTHRIILENANFKVANACVTYVSSRVITTHITPLPNININFYYSHRLRLANTTLPPLLIYLCSEFYFVFHLSECEEGLSEDLLLKLVFTLSQKPQWLDILVPHVLGSTLASASPLQIGCILGHLPVAQKLLANNSGIPTAKKSGHEWVGLNKILNSSGFWMCWKISQSKNMVPIIRLMIENDAKFSMTDGNLLGAFRFAVEYGFIELFEPLISGVADISSATDSRGMTALRNASVLGNIEAMEFLFSRGADVSAAGNMGQTALHYAAIHGHSQAIDLLLSKGADVSAADNEGQTALHHAAIRGHSQAIDLLLSKGADVSAADNEGQTALHYAAIHGHSQAIDLLLSKGVDVSVADNEGQTALHHATIRGHSQAIDLLLSKGADVSAADNEGQTALHYAAIHGHSQTIDLLLSKGVDVSAADNEGQTALHHATIQGNMQAIDLLLSKGADISATDSDGWTALHHAAINNDSIESKELIKLLAFRGADISAVDINGKTALHLAARWGSAESIKALFETGDADTSVEDVDGKTALQCVEEHKLSMDIIQIFSGLHQKKTVSRSIALRPRRKSM